MARLLRALVIIVSLTAGVAGVVLLQKRLTAFKDPSWYKENLSYLPQTDRIKPWLMGFHVAYADFLWIKTTIYFGGHYLTDRDVQWLTSMVDIITRIHPNFYPPYEFAGVLIPEMCHDPASARIILERGCTIMGNRKWNMYFMLGMIWYEFYNDKARAARCFELAARVPSPHSGKLATLAASFLKQSGQENRAREFLTFMYNTSEDPAVKKRIMDKLLEMKTLAQ